MGDTSEFMMAKHIKIQRPCTPKAMPKRSRYRTRLRAEQYGGSCDVEMFATDLGNNTLIYHEDCILCKEHCLEPNGTIKRVIDMKLLTYPTKDPKCVGFCPQDCEWETPSTEKDCKAEWENYLSSTQNTKEKEKKNFWFSKGEKKKKKKKKKKK